MVCLTVAIIQLYIYRTIIFLKKESYHFNIYSVIYVVRYLPVAPPVIVGESRDIRNVEEMRISKFLRL